MGKKKKALQITTVVVECANPRIPARWRCYRRVANVLLMCCSSVANDTGKKAPLQAPARYAAAV